jgi:hypothetical protein
MPHLTWVNGVPARPGEPSWMRYLSDVILGDLSHHAPRDSTRAAETGLGLSHSMYWYIGTAIEAYSGDVVGVWDPQPALTLAEGGTCPFDTGGLWHGRFTTSPPLLDRAEILAYFRVCDIQLQHWESAVAASLVAGWSEPDDYVSGAPPAPPITPRDHSMNTSPQAWVWEGRVATSDKPTTRLDLVELYWTEGSKRRFFSWLLRYGGLSDPDRSTLLEAIRRVSRPVADVFPSVQDRLLGLASA